MPEGNFKELRKSDLRKPEVWSVQRGGAVPVGSADHSKFAEGSCYLVLHTQSIQGTTEGLNIHVWQGKSASKAEADAAAALADELYKTLGSQVLQHRQVQGHESQSFMQAFNGAVFYVRGTAASSKPSGQTVTLSEVQMQGRRSTRVQECAAQASSLRTSGCFILRGSSVIYAWAGSTAPRALRASMLKAAMRLSCSNVEVVPLEEQDRSSPNAQAFYRELGAPDPSTVQIESRASSTAGHASDAMTIPRLFRVTDGSAGPLVGDAFPGTPHAGMLDGETAAMLVAGNMAHFWVSAATGPIDCQTGFDIAEQLLGQLSMPFSAPVQLVQQGTEPDAFWQHLGKGQPSVARSKAEHSTPVSNGTAADASDDAMFADPKSTTTMWRVKGSTATEVPAKQAAQFYSGNVYYIHHSFKDNGAQTHFLFIWQGSDASQIDVEGSGIAANAYDKKRCNGSANQVRVPQGREPSFFPLLFKGKAIFHQGSAEELTKTPMRPALYKLEGSGKAAQSRQVEVQASSLSSSGCFLLLTASSSVFQWQSRASSKDDQKAATGFANRLMPYAIRKTVVAEGEEPDAFWEAIGGKGNYQSEAATAPEPAAHEPQLLLFSEAAPDSLEDLPDYTQEDLDDDEIFLLDAFYTVFVWAGRDSDPAKQKAAQKKGQHLGQRDGRAANTPVSLVLPGQEPSLFTAAFPSWNAKRAAQANDPFQRAMTALSTKQPSQAREDPQDDTSPARSGRSPVKFGRALPGLANPERDAQNSSVSPAEPSSSPSNHQPQGQSTAASSRREDSRASGEPKPNNMFQSASGDNNGPLVSDSPVKPGRPLPGMAGPASFRQGGAPDATQTSSLSSDRQPHAQNRDSPVSASQPEVSMQLQETQQQLSETSSSGKNPPGTSHLQSGQRHSSEGEIFDASTSSRNQQRGPPPDAHAASPLSAANAAQRQQGSQPAGSQPANAAQHVGNKNGVSGRVMNAPHSHFDDDTRRRYADGTQQSHGARLSTSSAAHNESPSKMQLGQSQPGLSPSTSKQLAQDRASSSEEPSVTIKARHLEGPAANDSESASRAQPSQSAQPSDISGGSRGLKPNNDVSDAGDAVPASASGASSQLPMEVPSAQDKRSFKEAQEAIARATASGQGSVAEAASLERVKPPITRSAVAARASSLEASIAPGARSSEGPGSEEAPRRRISRLNVASIFNAQAALADKGTSAFPKPNLPPASAPPPPPTDLKLFPGQDFIEYEELKGMRAEDGLDMTRKEEYLNDAAFAKVFGQEREAYKKLPRWRQVLLKKQHKLF
ncbi:hypothetical protein WJX84_007247 [Apatococcus fuscideae]|uniref:HP domain-containing protein n=1 Tax=Apatococcus fuscideae TaxID=2026836 RepID=A0AAW1T5D4_9CHLO